MKRQQAATANVEIEATSASFHPALQSPTATYDPFYMKLNQVYTPENFDGKVTDHDSMNEAQIEQESKYYLGQVEEKNTEQRLYDEINERGASRSRRLKDLQLYDLPEGEDVVEKQSRHLTDQEGTFQNPYLEDKGKWLYKTSRSLGGDDESLTYDLPRDKEENGQKVQQVSQEVHHYDEPDAKEEERKWLYNVNDVDKQICGDTAQQEAATGPLVVHSDGQLEEKDHQYDKPEVIEVTL